MDRLADIFKRQAAYLETLKPIYRQNGFPLHAAEWPLNFSGKHEQEEFRLLAWRFTEEMVEAMECFEDGCPRPDYHEEMADALHFLIELCLATGVSYSELVTGIQRTHVQPPSGQDSLDVVFNTVKRDPIYSQRWFGSIRSLALGMMALRQRPWRTDNRGGDKARFILMLQASFYSFVNVCTRTGITAQELYQAYFAKAKINDERTKLQNQNCIHGIPRQFCTAVHPDDQHG